MKKKGSAILTVIGIISVLSILALSFISSSKEKVAISKNLSDEKKVEAIAESASDMILSYLRKNANKHDTPSKLYYLLRAPLKYKNPNNKVDNRLFKVDGLTPLTNFEADVGYKSALDPVIADLGWTGKIKKLESKCELVNAESFTPSNLDYEVTSITKEHLEATGNSAKFLDSKPNNINFNSETDVDVWANGDWKVNLAFPHDNEKYTEKKFKVHVQLDPSLTNALNEKQNARAAFETARANMHAAEEAYQAAVDAGSPDDYLQQKQDELNQAIEAYNQTVDAYNQANEDLEDVDNSDLNSGLGINVKLKVERDDPESLNLYIKAEICVSQFILGLFGIDKYITIRDEENNRDYYDIEEIMEKSKVFTDIQPIVLKKLREKVTGSEQQPNYDFSSYVNDIRDRMNTVSDGYKTIGVNTLNDVYTSKDVMQIEKGGILRITTTVEYEDSNSKKIKRVLVSEIPFKTTDVQPIAPEYSFFVANSSLISGENPSVYTYTLGNPVNMNDTSINSHSASHAAGEFIIHNNPSDNGKPSYDFTDGTRVPGMVRINTNYESRGDPTTDIYSFLGTFNEPELTELNYMFTPYKNPSVTNPFESRISFHWLEDSPKRKHEIEFPVMFQTDSYPNTKIENPGVLGFVDVYRRQGYDFVIVPTLLYGIGHMEYPLGINAEGPINSIYSRLRVKANPIIIVSPKADPKIADATEIYYSYEKVNTFSNGSPYDFDSSGKNTRTNNPAKFGMINHGSYNENQPWRSNEDFKYMPSNCYDALQYAKKATRFYENGGEFLDDCNKTKANGGLKNIDNSIELNGVYYIKNGIPGDGDVCLKIDSPLTFTGNGLIVAKKSIEINRNISLKDKDKDSLGIIARGGNITFSDNCTEVDGAYFSNIAPIFTGSTKVNGNLVCNEFSRPDVLKTEIFYDNRITSVTPLASLRRIGKFEPKRYHVAFADNWSKFAYEKEKDNQ